MVKEISKSRKILILGDASSIHTIRWVNSLSENGYIIRLFTLSPFDQNNYAPQIQINSLNLSKKIINKSSGNFNKLLYLKSIRILKKIKKEFKPDIIHAYYVSSYGLLASCINFNPTIISAWGTDIYEFPEKNLLNKLILKYVLNRAKLIFSTSQHMAEIIAKYNSEKKIKVIPFGVDTNKFSPVDRIINNEIIIGTVKTLEDTYGIDTLIKAFQLVKSKIQNILLKLIIVGTGSKKAKLLSLAESLKISEFVEFVGFVDHSTIESYHQRIDICVYLSRRESFGVSILESSACAKPIVASKIDGLVEVVKENYTGFLVEPDDPEDAANAIIKLIKNYKLRTTMGKNGRDYVIRNFSWNHSVVSTLNEYDEVLKNVN